MRIHGFGGAVRALATFFLVAGCDPGTGDGAGVLPSTAAGATPRTHYIREYVFLSSRDGEPLVVPFAFRSANAGTGVDRVVRAWMGQGSRWSTLLDESWQTPSTGGMWRILPRGDFKIAARGPSEVEALWLRQGDRQLRLQVGAAVSGWVQGENARFRVQQGRLAMEEEVIPGAVLQLLKVDRAGTGRRATEPSDWLFLAAGDSLRLVVARGAGAQDRVGTSFAWTGRPDGDRAWEMAEIEWMEMRPVERTQREIPLRWRFRIPEAGVHGQIHAIGYETVVGAVSAGKRAVEARYTVQGWVEVDGRMSPVQGMARHSQR